MKSSQKNRHRSRSIVSDIASNLPEVKSNLRLDVHSTTSDKSETGIDEKKLNLLKSSVDDLLISRSKIQTEPFSILDPLQREESENIRNGYLNSFGYDVLLSPKSFNFAFRSSVTKYLKFQNEIILKYNQNNATLEKIEYLQQCINKLNDNYENIKNDTKEFQAKSDQLISEYEEITKFHNQLTSDLKHFDNLTEINAFLNKPGLNKIVKSSKFTSILKNMDNSLKFIEDNPDFLDAGSYKSTLHSSLGKALTLVRTYVINSLNTTYNMVSKNLSQIKEYNSVITDAFIYNKFESNAEQMNKYIMILYDKKRIYGNEYDGLLSDIFGSYFNIRMNLISPIINSNFGASTILNNDILQVFEDNLSFYIDLINKEYEIFYKFFNEFRLVEEIESTRISSIDIQDIRSPTGSTYSLDIRSLKQAQDLSIATQNSIRNVNQFGEEPDYTENPEFNYFDFLNYGSEPFLTWIHEQVLESVYDFLRNKILKEQNIKILCQLTIMLQKFNQNDNNSSNFSDNQESNKFRIDFAKLFNPILTDLQARLIFRVQVFIDDSIMKYKPRLDDFKISSKDELSFEVNNDVVDESTEKDKCYANWYPTLKKSIILLTQIDQLVNNAIFDDLAHHVIHLCIQSLREAYSFSLKTCGAKDSSLFLIKNLLILKKNVEALDIEYTSYNDVDIDFSGLKEIFNNVKTGQVFKNGLISLARDTIPKLVTNLGDAKLELQIELRNSVHTFIESIVLKVNSILQEPVKADTDFEQLTIKYKEGLRAEFKSLSNILPLYIDDPVVINYLIDGIKELLIQNYELLYNKIVDCVENDSLIDKEKLNNLMELDVLINYLDQLSNEYRIIDEPYFEPIDGIGATEDQEVDNSLLFVTGG